MKVSESLLTITNMQYVLIIHEVVNYPAWKEIFDDAAEIRKKAGELSYQVLSIRTSQIELCIFQHGLLLRMLRDSLSRLNLSKLEQKQV